MKRDITATGALLCRHGFVLIMMDIMTGERYIYCILMLYALMFTSLPDGAVLPIGVLWYDINCKFGRYLKNWADGLPEPKRAFMLRILTPLPGFHKYAHR